jgi:two-component system sensor histidine kinase KdpD
MKALRFVASVLIIAAILALYLALLPVNNTTVALTLLLAIQDPQNWVALLAFLVTAVTASQLSARARRRAAEAEARRLEIERLYALMVVKPVRTFDRSSETLRSGLVIAYIRWEG